MTKKMNIVIYSAYLIAMLVFTILQISVVCDAVYMVDYGGFYERTPITIASINFTCVSALFGCILVIPETRKKLKVFCTILFGISFLLALFYTINAYAGFIGARSGGYELAFNYTAAVIPAVVAVGSFLIENDSFDLDNKVGVFSAVTRAAEMLLIVLMAIVLISHDADDTVQLIASTAMISFALSLSTLASRFDSSKIKLIVCGAAWLIMIMPIIYLFKGYWGVSGGFIDAVSVISVLGAFACAIVTVLIDLNIIKKKSAGWSCPQCGKHNIEGVFCEGCGAKKPEPWTCPSCGKTGNTKNFCGKCGQKKEM